MFNISYLLWWTWDFISVCVRLDRDTIQGSLLSGVERPLEDSMLNQHWSIIPIDTSVGGNTKLTCITHSRLVALLICPFLLIFIVIIPDIRSYRAPFPRQLCGKDIAPLSVHPRLHQEMIWPDCPLFRTMEIRGQFYGKFYCYYFNCSFYMVI